MAAPMGFMVALGIGQKHVSWVVLCYLMGVIRRRSLMPMYGMVLFVLASPLHSRPLFEVLLAFENKAE